MNWAQVPLEEAVTLLGGGTPSKQKAAFWDGDIPWISPKDMSSRDLFDSIDHITDEAVVSSATQMVPANAVLLVVRSGILVRKVPIGIVQRPVTMNLDMKALVPNPRLLDSDFLAYLLESRQSLLLSNYVKRGATVHSLQIDKLRKMPIPLPPLAEQRRIVEILDQADALRKKRAEADAKAARILPALFYEMFGDPATNPKGWKFKPLGELAVHLTSGSRGWSRYTGEGNALFLRTQDIKDGEITPDLISIAPPPGAEAERTRLQNGDVVVTITGNVGKAAAFRANTQDVYVSQHVALVRPDPRQLHPAFLTSYANLPLGEIPVLARFQYGQTKPGLGFRELTGSLVPVPLIALQAKFGARLDALRAVRLSSSSTKMNVENLWQALHMRAFSGELTEKWREATGQNTCLT